MATPPLINLPKLNFNLLVFITGIITIGYGEYSKSYILELFGIAISFFSFISLSVCLWAYTRYYWKVTKDVNKKKRSN